MSAFNPWLGFPARNAIYLDQDFDRQRGNGQAAYGTTQTAYDAANAIQVSSGAPVVIMVGRGSFGNLTLTADYNSSVFWCGINKNLSSIGIIDARANPAWSINLTFSNLTIGNVLSGSTGASNTAPIIITGNGKDNCVVGNVLSNAAGSSNGGDITVNFLTCGLVQSNRAGVGSDSGSITINACNTSHVSSGFNEGTPGDITISNYSITGNITVSDASGTGSGVVSVDKSETGIITYSSSGSTTTARDSRLGRIDNSAGISHAVKLKSCSIKSSNAACIESIEDLSILDDCILVATGGNNPCIADCSASTSGTIINSVLIPSGTGASINDAIGATIFIENVQMKNDVDPLVTVNGNYVVMGNLISPI